MTKVERPTDAQAAGPAGTATPELLRWWRTGEAQLRASVPGLELDRPSALPGWTRAHVVGHLIGNAYGLTNLLSWAETGIEKPMYVSDAARRADIEQRARRPQETLQAEFTQSQQALIAAVEALPASAWTNLVRSALGRSIPVSEVLWLRTRETWIHQVDLQSGFTFADLPSDLVDALLTDVTGTLTTRPQCPAVDVAPRDRSRRWRLGPPDVQPVTVEATAAESLGWVLGRGPELCDARSNRHVALPAWL